MPGLTACAPEVLVMENPVVTTRVRFWVFAAGAPVAFAVMVIGNAPNGVLALVVRVSDTVTGFAEVGFTELAG